MQITDTDRRVLRQLMAAPNDTTAALAERAGVTPSTAARRLEKLSKAGIVQGQERTINWPALGYAVRVSLRITVDKTQPRAFEDGVTPARSARAAVVSLGAAISWRST
ncbi:MAG: Lrp/AsnC family transcriptional regulator, partial [Pseudomonadota bacterium]